MATRNRIRLTGFAAACGLALTLAGGATAGPLDDAVLVKSVSPAIPYAGTSSVVVGDTLFFTPRLGGSRIQLWKSDGTDAGTKLVRDIFAGGNAEPSNLVEMGGTLYFRATNGTDGFELWKSDGTFDGTQMVKNINANPSGSSTPAELTVVGNTLFFSASDGTGTELWKSDGTVAGTVPISNPSSPLGGSTPQGLVRVGNKVFFSAFDSSGDSELYTSDGSPAVSPAPEINPTGSSTPEVITAFNGKAFFSADDGTNGVELWRSDGDTVTRVEQNIASGGASSFPRSLEVAGDTLFFSAEDTTGNRELWKTDGTGAFVVRDITNDRLDPNEITSVGDKVFFSGFDVVNNSAGSERELWVSDGTINGTRLVKNINSNSATGSASLPEGFTNFNGTLYFSANDGSSGFEPWKSDGTEDGTVLVKDVNLGGTSSNPRSFTRFKGSLFFSAFGTSSNFQLWKIADTIPPVVTIDSGPAEGDTLTSGSPTFGFSSDDLPASFGCRIYPAGSTPPAFGACSGPGATHAPPAPLANGSYTFEVQGSDVGGNSATASRSFSVAVPPSGPGPIGPGPIDPGPSAPCLAARADLRKAEKKLSKAKSKLKKAKKSDKAAKDKKAKAKVKKAKAKVKKAKAKVKKAKADVGDDC